MIQKHSEILRKLNITPKTVLEVGSRDGNDSNYYKEEFNLKNEDIYIVEPNPLMVNQIKLKYPNYTIFEFAIDETEGTKEFNQVIGGGQDPIGVSSLLDRTDNFYERFPTNKITVSTIKGSTLLEMINKEIDICKIDVEGLTYEVISSFGDDIKKIKTFHLETEHHLFWKNQKLHPEVVELMENLGYKLAWWDQDNSLQADAIWVREDVYIDCVKNIMKDVEIHTLICNRDILLAINNFKSLQKFDEFSETPIFLHDDGSLTDTDIETLSIIKNTILIRRIDADREIRKYIEDYEHCFKYRLGENKINLWHKIKSFDYFFFSKTKKVLGVDTDLLFLRKPNNVIENIVLGIPFYFPDVQSAYSFNEPKDEIPVLNSVNTGLIYIPSEEYYNINDIENALKNLTRNGVNYFPSWIEQSAFAHMFYMNGKYVNLNTQKYRIPYFQPVDIENTECLHFVSYPAVRETYETYLDYLDFGVGDLLYENRFEVDFKDIKIPLEFKIYKSNGIYSFSYYWGLEKTSQQFLDHIFKIKTDEGEILKKLQSDKNGFFIITTKSKNISLSHTYDWYNEQNWVNFGQINL